MTLVTPILPPEATLDAAVHDLPADDTRAAQHQFTAERQAAFLSRLAECGSARSAVKAAQVSHQTAYRQRRACRQFRRAWDAALLVARTAVEEVLACRAIDGIEEEVWFRGELVGTRRRHDTRLLLAHLARLDRLAEDADAAMLAEDFDAVVAAVEAGGELPPVPQASRHEVPACAGTQPCGNSPSGPCNMRSMSPGDALNRDTDTEALPELERRLQAMEAALPDDAPPVPRHAAAEVEAIRLEGFEAGVEEWWLMDNWDDLDAALDLLEEQEAAEAEASPAAPA